MKITKSELKQIIKEEAERFVKIKSLEAQKKDITNQLNEWNFDKKDDDKDEEEDEDDKKDESLEENVEECDDEKLDEVDAPEEDGEKIDEVFYESKIRKIVREEAVKASKIKVLSERATSIIKEMNEMGYTMEEEEDFTMEDDMEEGIGNMFRGIAGIPSKEDQAKGRDLFEKTLKELTNKYMKSMGGDMEKVNKYVKTKDDNNKKQVPGIQPDLLRWAAKQDYFHPEGKLRTTPISVPGGGKGLVIHYVAGRGATPGISQASFAK